MKHKNKIIGLITGITQRKTVHGYPQWTVTIDTGGGTMRATTGHNSPCNATISNEMLFKTVQMTYTMYDGGLRLLHLEEV